MFPNLTSCCGLDGALHSGHSGFCAHQLATQSQQNTCPHGVAVAASVALVANIACLLVLSRHRGRGVHMQASWIFTSNDVIANAGVILAGALVAWTSSAIPDLIIGGVIGLVVLRGAVRILKISRRSQA